jgi:hypothetical protein
MLAAGQPRAVSSTWQVRKPVGAGVTAIRSRIHAILRTCAVQPDSGGQQTAAELACQSMYVCDATTHANTQLTNSKTREHAHHPPSSPHHHFKPPDLGQRVGQLGAGRVAEPARVRAQDSALRGVADREDERETEPRLVVRVHPRKALHLGRRKAAVCNPQCPSSALLGLIPST